MANTVRALPLNVWKAKRDGDKKTLSELGKRGNQSMKKRRERIVEQIKTERLIGSKQMREQANEDICPLD